MKERYLKRNINTNDTYTTPNNNQPIKKSEKSHFSLLPEHRRRRIVYLYCLKWADNH